MSNQPDQGKVVDWDVSLQCDLIQQLRLAGLRYDENENVIYLTTTERS
jgi:hypothetical protein